MQRVSDKPNLQVEENKRIAEGVHKRRRLYTVVNTFQMASCTISPPLPAL